MQTKTKLEKATFAAGCFWGVEEAFRTLKGVVSTQVGYTGASVENPNYDDVCSGRTGHAEAIQVNFDPKKISYEKLLERFWSIHDPTQLNRQGPDVGAQYRSVIFFHNAKQKETAEKSKANLEKTGIKPVTKIIKASEFYKAEDYHQQYLSKRNQKVCH